VLGQLVELALGVEGVAPQPGVERLGDVGRRLHGVAVQHPLGVDAQLLEHLELGAGGDLEAGAELVEGAQQLWLGVALDGVEAADPRQGRGQGGVALADRLQVADQERGRMVHPVERLGLERAWPVGRQLEPDLMIDQLHPHPALPLGETDESHSS